MNIVDFKNDDWTSQWAGKWCILAFSYWGNFYCRRPFSKDVDRYVDHCVIISREGKGWCYQRGSVKKIFAEELKEKILADGDFVKDICDNLKIGAAKLVDFIETNIDKDISYAVYAEFQRILLDDYYPYHIENKLVADVLNEKLFKKFFPFLEEARVYAEPIFNKVEEFMQALGRIHEAKVGLPAYLILASTKHEFTKYLRDGKNLPVREILEKRYQESAYLFDEKNMEVVLGPGVKKLDDIIRSVKNTYVLCGSIAYPGKAIGRVKIVLDVNKYNGEFGENDILVAGMTRPEYLPMMKKAIAFVTDSGGVLSHAAITARELKKPCIVGTEVATKVLKDGDMVEVDAEKGTVRKIV